MPNRRIGTTLVQVGMVLYLSRLLAELGARISWPALAVAGGLIGLGAGYVLLRRTSRIRWPALLLWIYVLYPAFDPGVGFLVGAVALLTWLATRCPDPPPKLVDAGVFVVALALYWLTLARGLLPADAGEFQLVAAKLGIAHPPGYPLYTLVGKVFTLIMPTHPMRGLNLFSALTAALAVVLAGRAARRLSGSAWGGVAASMALAVAASVWATATQASIRPLMAFFTALCVEKLAAYRNGSNPKALVGFALAFGLGLAHHPSLIFPGLFFLIYLLLIDPALLVQLRRWPLPLFALALGFLPWLYVPLRGAMGAPLAPDNIATWDGFWQHVLARGFGGDFFYFRTPSELLDRGLVWLNILALEWNGVILALAALSGIVLAWRDRRSLVLLGGGFALHSFVTMTYRAPQTVEYLIPAYVLLAVGLGAGLGYLSQLCCESEGVRGEIWRTAGPVLRALLIVAAVVQAVQLWPSFATLARDDSTRTYAEAIFEQAPPDAVVLANWHWAMPLQALQQIEGARPDIEVRYVFPAGAESLAQTWVRHIEAEIGQRPVIVTGFYPTEYGLTPYFFEPLGPAWLVRESPRRDLPPGMTALDYAFDNGLAIAGYEVASQAAVGGTFELRLAWRIDRPLDQDVTGSVHLVNPSLSISNSDVPLPTSRLREGEVWVTRHILGMPPYGLPSPLDDYWLLASAYTLSDEGLPETISHAGRFTFFTLSEIAIDPPAWPAPSAHPHRVVFANGARLSGYDWEGETLYLHSIDPDGRPRTIRTTSEGASQAIAEQIAGASARLGLWGIPLRATVRISDPRPGERYVSLGGEMILSNVAVEPEQSLSEGQTVTIDLRLLSAHPLLADRVIKVDLIGQGYTWRAQSDHIPATGALPTLKWLWGWRVADRHRLTLPADVLTTQAHAEMLVYDHFTGQVLPLLDIEQAKEGITLPVYAWTP